MSKPFEFADFVHEFWVDFTIESPIKGAYNGAGKYVQHGFNEPVDGGGIVLPLGEDDKHFIDNGTYTAHDRKIYTLKPLEIGARITYNGNQYIIDRYKDYEAYADVYIYFSKGATLNGATTV